MAVCGFWLRGTSAEEHRQCDEGLDRTIPLCHIFRREAPAPAMLHALKLWVTRLSASFHWPTRAAQVRCLAFIELSKVQVVWPLGIGKSRPGLPNLLCYRLSICGRSVFKPKEQFPRRRSDGDEIIRPIVGDAAAG
jgi:hypothetical protein